VRNSNRIYRTAGTSALCPEPEQSHLVVINGGSTGDNGSVRSRDSYSARTLVSDVARWNRSGQRSVCAAPILNDCQQLAGELGFLLVAALVILTWAISL
jgi:hypothetical protein